MNETVGKTPETELVTIMNNWDNNIEILNRMVIEVERIRDRLRGTIPCDVAGMDNDEPVAYITKMHYLNDKQHMVINQLGEVIDSLNILL